MVQWVSCAPSELLPAKVKSSNVHLPPPSASQYTPGTPAGKGLESVEEFTSTPSIRRVNLVVFPILLTEKETV